MIPFTKSSKPGKTEQLSCLGTLSIFKVRKSLPQIQVVSSGGEGEYDHGRACGRFLEWKP